VSTVSLRDGRGRTAGTGGLDRADRPGLMWAMPALAFFAFFALLPMALVIYLSLTDWEGIGTPHVVGMDNWTRLIHDSSMLESLRLSAILTAAVWVTQTPLALLIGVWSAGRQRFRAVLSAIFFLPLVLSLAAVALAWTRLMDPNFGLAAYFGPWIGIQDGNIIGTATGAMVVVVVVVAWQFVPFHALLYQAAARGIPREFYEAAVIDGAGRVRQFFSVTLPQLKNTVVTSSVIMIVGSLTYFETVLLLTDGGPGTSTRILPMFMYVEGFRQYQMGYASAIATVLVVLGFVLSFILVRVSGFAKMRSTREGE
jgi:xylobiose transport system permease protein